MSEIKLTQFSKGAGCGCKIAPALLETILAGSRDAFPSAKLLIGNQHNDDAAVYDMGNGQSLISTTDFFTPIVDDAFTFGQIAAANAISDVYAMGGSPLMAIAILGWPVDLLPAILAGEVIKGATAVCTAAGIPLAGGHSIDVPEPFFGLSVNGIVQNDQIKKNNTAQSGDLLMITKPLGVGILSTAQKRGLLNDADLPVFINQLTELNSIGTLLGSVPEVHAMTDITGFGLLGHLIEMTDGSNLSAELQYNNIPILESAKSYLGQRIVPDATYRNWNSYNQKVSFESGVNVMEAFSILPDPQTNGGLLIAIAPASLPVISELFQKNNLSAFIKPIGILKEKGEKTIVVTC